MAKNQHGGPCATLGNRGFEPVAREPTPRVGATTECTRTMFDEADMNGRESSPGTHRDPAPARTVRGSRLTLNNRSSRGRHRRRFIRG